MFRFGALRQGNQDRGNLQRQDVNRQRINQEIRDGTSPIGQKYENMKKWQQKLLDGDFCSDIVVKRLRDSCFGKLILMGSRYRKSHQFFY